MTLIIRDALVNPPTWFTSFWDLTLLCHTFLRFKTVIESEDVDIYYKWLKRRGGMEYVDDFVRPGTEDGIRLDVELNYPGTIVTDRIVPENTEALINRIRFALKIG
jgi:hypothetical protein